MRPFDKNKLKTGFYKHFIRHKKLPNSFSLPTIPMKKNQRMKKLVKNNIMEGFLYYACKLHIIWPYSNWKAIRWRGISWYDKNQNKNYTTFNKYLL